MTTTFKKLTPNIMVEDVNTTVEFYKDVLGFQVLTTVPESGQLNWAMLGRDGVELMLQSRSSLGEEMPSLLDKAIGASMTFYIAMQGVQELYETLKGRVRVVQEMHTTFYNTREFAVQDNNGYILAFAENQ